jgi:hypothetical protein
MLLRSDQIKYEQYLIYNGLVLICVPSAGVAQKYLY